MADRLSTIPTLAVVIISSVKIADRVTSEIRLEIEISATRSLETVKSVLLRRAENHNNCLMNLQIYRDEHGNEPFEQWLSSIRDTRTSARIDNRLRRVRLGLLGDQRSLGDGVFELRLDFGAGYRIYFGRIGREDILLLMGGDKTSQRRDIARAKRYWQHFRESMS